MLAKIIHAGAALPSFELAAKTLFALADLSVSGRHVGRLTEAIGAELVAARDTRAEQHRQRKLEAQVANVPSVVVVEVDGGRYQQRADGSGPGVFDPAWREDKGACVLSLTSGTHEVDPQPEPPACFLDRRHVRNMTRQSTGEESPEESGDTPPPVDADPPIPAWQPQRLVRTCVATTRTSEEFGRLVGAEAQARNFAAASRKAFVADGQAYNWSIQERWFADYVPVVDFIHVLGYVWQAATALGGSERQRWDRYATWMRSCWQGRASEVLAELEGEQQRVGTAPADAEPTDVRVVLERVRGYLTNNATRMDYPSIRRSGLPVTSSWMESLIKEINYRVKGTEKFWNVNRAESVLQVRAALLSDDDRLAEHMAARPGSAFRRQPVARAA